jgi:hypothetical protein
MKKLLLLLLLPLFIVLGTNEADAQMRRKAIKKNNRRISSFRGKKSNFGKEKAYSMIGFSLNALNYYGDLAPKPTRFSTDIGFTRPALGLVFAHRFGPRYALTGTFFYGTLKGSDAESADKNDENAVYRYQRNLSFRNRIKELSIVASMDLWENQSTYLSRVKWTPYAFLGLAIFHHNPQAQAPETDLDGTPLPQAGEWVDLKPLGTEGQHANLRASDANHGIKKYKLIQPAIPFGLGARFRLNQVMDFSVELGFRYVFTDYLDDVSKNYVDLGVFGNDELAKAMSYRSNELPEVSPRLVATPSTVDGHNRSYSVLPGYGQENAENLRGNRSDKDTYMVTTFKLTYVFGKTFHRAKFR